jgi:hypothetical protein
MCCSRYPKRGVRNEERSEERTGTKTIRAWLKQLLNPADLGNRKPYQSMESSATCSGKQSRATKIFRCMNRKVIVEQS